MNNVAGVELEGIIRGAGFRQNDGGVERVGAAGGSMRHEMNIGELLGLALQICRRSCVLAGKYLVLCRWKMFVDVLDFGGRFSQFGIVRVRRNRISDQEQAARRFV